MKPQVITGDLCGCAHGRRYWPTSSSAEEMSGRWVLPSRRYFPVASL